jgi:N6-adenosine-specific RNA methylase IME4
VIALPPGPFDVIYADPPWNFRTRSAAGRGKSPRYDVMVVEEIAALPIAEIAARDCWLFLWVTNPNTRDGFDLLDAWGFNFSGVFQTWFKLRQYGPGFHFGMGYGSRQNTERVLLARRGRPKRRDASIPEVLVWPVMEHSRKPGIVRHRIERFAGASRRLELFARERRPGWSAWGNEVGKFADRLPTDDKEEVQCLRSFP